MLVFAACSVAGAMALYFIVRFVLNRFVSRKLAGFVAGGVVISGGLWGSDAAPIIAITGVALLLVDMARLPAKG